MKRLVTSAHLAVVVAVSLGDARSIPAPLRAAKGGDVLLQHHLQDLQARSDREGEQALVNRAREVGHRGLHRVRQRPRRQVHPGPVTRGLGTRAGLVRCRPAGSGMAFSGLVVLVHSSPPPRRLS